MVGEGEGSTEVHLIMAQDLAALDAADGTDGEIDLNLVASTVPTGSYQLNGISPHDLSGYSIAAAGDVDGDGLAGILMGAAATGTPNVSYEGEAYLVTAPDLAALDDVGAGQDSVIELSDLFKDNIVQGTTWNDLINATYFGDPGLDRVDNTDNGASTDDNVIHAGAGADTVFGGAGNDTIVGNEGQDTINGGDRDDMLSGNNGADTLFGGSENDVLLGGARVRIPCVEQSMTIPFLVEIIRIRCLEMAGMITSTETSTMALSMVAQEWMP